MSGGYDEATLAVWEGLNAYQPWLQRLRHRAGNLTGQDSVRAQAALARDRLDAQRAPDHHDPFGLRVMGAVGIALTGVTRG